MFEAIFSVPCPCQRKPVKDILGWIYYQEHMCFLFSPTSSLLYIICKHILRVLSIKWEQCHSLSVGGYIIYHHYYYCFDYFDAVSFYIFTLTFWFDYTGCSEKHVPPISQSSYLFCVGDALDTCPFLWWGTRKETYCREEGESLQRLFSNNDQKLPLTVTLLDHVKLFSSILFHSLRLYFCDLLIDTINSNCIIHLLIQLADAHIVYLKLKWFLFKSKSCQCLSHLYLRADEL